jgi:hypothetical protein
LSQSCKLEESAPEDRARALCRLGAVTRLRSGQGRRVRRRFTLYLGVIWRLAETHPHTHTPTRSREADGVLVPHDHPASSNLSHPFHLVLSSLWSWQWWPTGPGVPWLPPGDQHGSSSSTTNLDGRTGTMPALKVGPPFLSVNLEDCSC